jgi:DNA modification methylase
MNRTLSFLPEQSAGLLIHGDALETMAQLADNQVAMTLTDIPYGEVSRKDSGLRRLDKGLADKTSFDLEPFIDEAVRVTSGSIYVFCGFEQASEVVRRYRHQGLKMVRVGAWEKTNPSPMNAKRGWLSAVELFVVGQKPNATWNGSYNSPVLRYSTTKSSIHPTQKPVALFRHLIEMSSHLGDVIFDPCAGSATTAVAAFEAGRRWLCVERDRQIVTLANQRINSLARLRSSTSPIGKRVAA